MLQGTINQLTIVSKMVQNLATTGNSTIVIPAGFMILDMLLKSNNGNAIVGGLRVGTTNGGTDVAVAIAVSGGAQFVVPESLMLKRIFSDTVDTTLYVQAVTLWNGANLDVKFVLRDTR